MFVQLRKMTVKEGFAMVQIDLTRCWELLGEIIGDSVHESLIDQLFSQFCLGK